MKHKSHFSIKALTEKIRNSPHRCPSCQSTSLKCRTDLLENLERGEDLLTKHCACNECGFAWEESYKVTLHEAISKDSVMTKIGFNKSGNS